jgi:hypothetical protein
MTPQEKFKERQQWFLDRIGKRVFRESNGCACDTCKRITKEGLIIRDKIHAIYLCGMEGISNNPIESNHPFKYKD